MPCSRGGRPGPVPGPPFGSRCSSKTQSPDSSGRKSEPVQSSRVQNQRDGFSQEQGPGLERPQSVHLSQLHSTAFERVIVLLTFFYLDVNMYLSHKLFRTRLPSLNLSIPESPAPQEPQVSFSGFSLMRVVFANNLLHTQLLSFFRSAFRDLTV